LSDYEGLIGRLPHLQQAFETKKSTWSRHLGDETFRTFYRKIFSAETSFVSRAEVFEMAQSDSKAGVLLTITWGYPRNMRGNSFATVLSSLPTIEKALSVSRDLNRESFQELLTATRRTGIGPSTLSKLLYFFRFRLDDYPCLILDERIIGVVSARRFSELLPLQENLSASVYRNYKAYLHAMHEISESKQYLADQLEFFLFLLGRNLKKIHSPKNY
jgi:hypothetical protein